MTWYSEHLTPLARWSPQTTPERPRETTTEGQRVTLRRVRKLRLDELHLDLGALQARADEDAAREYALAQEAAMERDGMVTVWGKA